MKRRGLLILLVTSLFLTGCTVRKNQVSYTVYPVGYIMNRIIGDRLQIESIQNGEMVQRATLKENYHEILSESEAFFHIGMLEPYMTTYSSKILDTKVTMKDLSSLNAIYLFQRYTPVLVDGEVSFIESPYYKGEIFDTIDYDKRDLHLWMDPIAMLSMSKDIKEWLVKTYPEDAIIYEENFSSLEKDLVQLDAEYQKLSSKLFNEGQEIKFVSMTSSFGNWQKTYGIQIYPIVLSKYGVLPTDEQLEAIERRIVNDGVVYIVYEPNMPEDMEKLFNEIEEKFDLKRMELSNLSSLSNQQSQNNKDYLSLMYENLATLQAMATPIVGYSNGQNNQEQHDAFDSNLDEKELDTEEEEKG